MGGPEPLVSHLKLFSLEKAAFETLDSLDSPDLSRGDDGNQVTAQRSDRQEHGPPDLQQQQDVLQQQLLKLKERRESGDVAEESPPHERSLLSPPQFSPKASSPKSPLRRMSRDSSASQSPMSPLGRRQTRPTLRGPGAKAGKVPTTPLNSPVAPAEAPAIFVSQARVPKANNSGKLHTAAPTPPVDFEPQVGVSLFRDKGLASALSSVPSRQRFGIPPEEIIPLMLDPPPAPALEPEIPTEGGTPSESLGRFNNEADQEWWKRLHEQLETMHRDVQDYAQRSCPSRRFVRVGPGQLGPSYSYGVLVEPRVEGLRLPVAGSASMESTGDLTNTRSGPLPRPPISRSSSQRQNSWQPPMTPQTPQFEPGLARQMPQQELQRQRVDSGLSGSKVSVSAEETESSQPSREVSRPTPPQPVGRMTLPKAGPWLRSPVPVVYQAPAASAGPIASERFVPVAPAVQTTMGVTPSGTRRPVGVVGQMPVTRSQSVGPTVGAAISGYGHPSPMTPRGIASHVIQRQSSCPSAPRAPSTPPTLVRCQMTPRSLDTKLNVSRVAMPNTVPGMMPGMPQPHVQYAAMPSGGQISWVQR